MEQCWLPCFRYSLFLCGATVSFAAVSFPSLQFSSLQFPFCPLLQVPFCVWASLQFISVGGATVSFAAISFASFAAVSFHSWTPHAADLQQRLKDDEQKLAEAKAAQDFDACVILHAEVTALKPKVGMHTKLRDELAKRLTAAKASGGRERRRPSAWAKRAAAAARTYAFSAVTLPKRGR